MAGQTSERPSLSALWRPALVGGSAAVLLYAALLAFLSHSTFPVAVHSGAHWPWLMDKPVGEDGYYMLTVADNIASRGKILYNWGIPATGIQPLVTVLFAGLDFVVRAFHAGSLALIRTVLLFSSALFLVFACQVRRITMSLCRPEVAQLAGALAFLLTLFDYTLFRLFTYGLETGVYLICIAACVSITIRIAGAGSTSTSNMLWLGLAAGLAGEARIDFGLLFAFVLGGLLLRRWITAGQALGAGGVALVLVSPWFLFVHRVSGSWLPSSGAAESTPISLLSAGPRLLAMFVAVISHFAPWSFGVYSKTTLLMALFSSGVLVALILKLRPVKTGGAVRLLPDVLKIWSPGMAVLLVAYYCLFNSSQFYYRYAAPLAVLAIPALAIAMAWSGQQRWSSALAACTAAFFAFWTAGSLHTGNISNSQAVATGYIQRNFPTAHVAAFQSGVLGYFNRNVENLDGKLNGPALVATRKHALPEFLDSEGVDVVIDWPSLIYLNLPPEYLARSWTACPVPVGQTESICIMRKPRN